MRHQYQFPIESQRVYFEPLGEKDLKQWEEFFLDNDQLAFVGITDPSTPQEESKKWIDRQVARYESSGVGILGAYRKEDHRLIGNCGLIWREDIMGEDLYEIGYSIIPSLWSMGYASEMASCFMEYFITHQLGKKVISIIAIDNLASQQVAFKNDMQKGPEFEFQGAKCYQFFRSFNH